MEPLEKALQKLVVTLNERYDASQSSLQNSGLSRKANSELINSIKKNMIDLEEQASSFVTVEISNSTNDGKHSPESDRDIDVVGSESSASSTKTLFDVIVNGENSAESEIESNWTNISFTSSSDEESNEPKNEVNNNHVPPNLDSTDSDEDYLENRNIVSESDCRLRKKPKRNLEDYEYKATLTLDGRILLTLKRVKIGEETNTM